MLHAVIAYVGKLHGQLSGAMTGERGSVRRDCQKNTAPAIHAGFRAFFVVVRRHENQLARMPFGFQLGAVLVGDAFSAHQLLFGRQ
ncbi:hypothetical protein D3C76_1619370 [compost metagenome]